MKRLLTLTLLSSLFLFAGCSKGGNSDSKNIGEKISYQDASDLIDEAESLLAKKEYSSRYIHKANLKNKVDFELETKLSFDIDQTSEFVCNIDKTNDKMLFTRKHTTYGNSKGTGKDWVKDPENSSQSFRIRYNASSADEFCKKLNEKIEQIGNTERYYEYSSSDDQTTIYSKTRAGVNYQTDTETENSNYIKMYGHMDYNNMHNLLYNIIEDGFEDEWLVAYKNNNTLTIKLVDNFEYGEIEEDTLRVKNWNCQSFREYIATHYRYDRSVSMYNPNNLKFAITIELNKDGSYKNFNSNLSFDSKIINYLSYPSTMASNGSIIRTFKKSFAEIKINDTQTETFSYSGVKVSKPSWINNMED